MGEGGGQVLRSSLTASMLTGKPVTLERIRAGRPKPGLMRQHKMAVDAAAAICGGEAEGVALGSTSLRFTPGKVRGGDYTFAIATAGSANLVLQTVLLPLVLADTPSTLILEGGTHNPMAPPFEFVAKTFLPVLARMGASVDVVLERYGFMPAGGGRIIVRITPVSKLTPLELVDRGDVRAQRGRVVAANIEKQIAYRQAHDVAAAMGWSEDAVDVSRVVSAGPGNVIQVEVTTAEHTEVFTAFGERGKHSSLLVREIADEARAYLTSDACVGIHLADQLLMPFAIAGTGRFTTVDVTEHTATNAAVIEKFFQTRTHFERRDRSTQIVIA
jgi:RNA 3'-terminal phosphate cyclase (ATP)